jgi:hypothetical protein
LRSDVAGDRLPGIIGFPGITFGASDSRSPTGTKIGL